MLAVYQNVRSGALRASSLYRNKSTFPSNYRRFAMQKFMLDLEFAFI